MRNKSFLLIALIAVIAAAALSGCKQDEDSPQRKIVVTGIESSKIANGLNVKLSLFKLETNVTPDAVATAQVSGGTATFAMLEKEDGRPFTKRGAYILMLTVMDADNQHAALGAGVTTPIPIIRETTNIPFSRFTFKGIGG